MIIFTSSRCLQKRTYNFRRQWNNDRINSSVFKTSSLNDLSGVIDEYIITVSFGLGNNLKASEKPAHKIQHNFGSKFSMKGYHHEHFYTSTILKRACLFCIKLKLKLQVGLRINTSIICIPRTKCIQP